MQIAASYTNGVTVLSLTGRMDATTVTSFEEAWRNHIDAGETTIVINLGGIEYISSAGLRGILALLKTCKSKKGTLAFCCLGDMVAEVFRISGFTSMLSMFATEEEAVNFAASK